MTTGLRVLHVINGLGTGGAERSLSELLPFLAEAGIASTVACLMRKPEGVHHLVEQQGHPVFVVGGGKVGATVGIHTLVRQWRPDIVHTTIFEADVLGRVASLGQACRVLSSQVNTYEEVRLADRSISRTKVVAARKVNAFTARHMTDHFHAISKAVKVSAVEHLGIRPDRVTVVERGRSLTRLGQPSAARRNRVRNANGIPLDAELVINIGRQEPQKDQSTLIEAVARLAGQRRNLLLVQVGREGKATPELRRLVRDRAIASRVRFLGHRDDVGDLLSAADVFAFPSIYEGLGGSLLEAMALGVPAVVTDVPALVDVVESGRAASIVPVSDAAALARALRHLLDNREEATRMAAQGRQIFSERFTLEQSAKGMIDLYERLAAGQMGLGSK